MRFRKTAIILALALFTAPGCSRSPQRQEVTGQVTFRGTPIAHGTVRFEPEDSKTCQPGGAVIENGRFRIPAEAGLFPGSYKVVLSAPEGKANVNLSGSTPVTGDPYYARELLPETYNLATTLTVTVQPGGDNDLTFNLE
jgi:hypothetical protein